MMSLILVFFVSKGLTQLPLGSANVAGLSLKLEPTETTGLGVIKVATTSTEGILIPEATGIVMVLAP